jgi:cytochrome c peroxidase
MRRARLTKISAVCSTIAAALLISPWLLSAQNSSQEAKAEPSPIYNPYPPGILPPDLNSEIARVLREVDFIEARAIARAQALTPPILTGQPPILQNTGTEAVETLGELMNYDKNISPNKKWPARLATCRTSPLAGRYRR